MTVFWLISHPEHGFIAPGGTTFAKDVSGAGTTDGAGALTAINGIVGLVATRGAVGETRLVAECHCHQGVPWVKH